MLRDPYSVLDVAPHATDEEIAWAYRRRLNEAAKLGAWKAAQDIDAAYTALRDPVRRQMLDQHGIAAPGPRVPPQASGRRRTDTAFRAWAPAPATPRPSAPAAPARYSWRVVAVALAIGAVIGASFEQSLHPMAPSTRVQVPPSGAGVPTLP